MKLSILAIASTAFLAHAAPRPANDAQDSGDTVNDMLDVIDGKSECQPVAAIFARGTFDSGNIGVWVGPQFLNGLKTALSNKVAIQGVKAADYPASLEEYLKQGGSDTGALSMADSVEAYTKRCPDSTILVSGWSQGALVAHKALNQLPESVLSKVAGVVTFGDPWHLFDDTALPASLTQSQLNSSCIGGSTFDPLCAELPEAFKIPRKIEDIVGPFMKLPSTAEGELQRNAAKSIIEEFPQQLKASWESFAGTLLSEDFVRLLLSPQHFMYGNNGDAQKMAEWAAGLQKVQESLAQQVS